MTEGETTLRAMAGAMGEVGGDGDGAFAARVASGLVAAIADGSQASVAGIAADVSAALDALVRKSPPEARDVARRSTARTPACMASYLLGQVDMAERVAAHLVVDRADPILGDACADPTFTNLLRAVHGKGQTVAGACAATGKHEPWVRQALNDLRLAGAVEASMVDGLAVHRLGDAAEAFLRAKSLLASPG